MPIWLLEEELVIGNVEGVPTEDHALTAVHALAVDGEGSVFVLQRDEALVRVFDGEGNFLYRIGRQGSGPAEFSRPESLGWHGGDLWINDPGSGRVTIVDPSGEHRESIEVRRSLQPLVSVSGGYLMRDGTVISEPVVGAQLIGEGRLDAIPLLRLDRAGEIMDTVASMPAVVSHFRMPVTVGGATRVVQGRQPISARSFHASAPDGSHLVIAHQPQSDGEAGTVRLTWYSPDTGSRSRGEVPYAPVPLPSEVADSIVDRWAAAFVEGNRFRSLSEARRSVSEALHLPDLQPPITGMTVSSEGDVWLRREAFRSDEHVLYDVIARGGEAVARVRAPEGARILAASASHAWGTVEDELGTASVVRYRVRRTRH